MTFLPDMVKMGYSEDEIFAVFHESEQDRKRRRVLVDVTETVAAYRLREIKDLQAREKLAKWRRMNGFDRVADGEYNWFHGPRSLPPTPEEFAASLWSEVNALKDAILMPARTRPWQKTMEFIEELKGDLPNEEFSAIKRYVERRSRDAAQVTVTPVSTAQYCSPRPQTPEPSPDVCVDLESNEGEVDPERDELESPSAGTGFETPGQQRHPIWETGRTTVDGFLTAGLDSNLGKHSSPTTERAGARAGTKITTASNTTFLQQGHKLKDKDKGSEENKQFDQGGKEQKPPPWNATPMVVCFFPGGSAGPGVPVVCALCSFSTCLLCSLFICCHYQVISFSTS